MDFEDIKIEYNTIMEGLYQVHNLVIEIIPALNNFLAKYYKLRNYNKQFAEKLESDLLHLERFLQIINDNIDEIEEVNLYKLTIPVPRFKVKSEYNDIIREYFFK